MERKALVSRKKVKTNLAVKQEDTTQSAGVQSCMWAGGRGEQAAIMNGGVSHEFSK